MKKKKVKVPQTLDANFITVGFMRSKHTQWAHRHMCVCLLTRIHVWIRCNHFYFLLVRVHWRNVSSNFKDFSVDIVKSLENTVNSIVNSWKWACVCFDMAQSSFISTTALYNWCSYLKCAKPDYSNWILNFFWHFFLPKIYFFFAWFSCFGVTKNGYAFVGESCRRLSVSQEAIRPVSRTFASFKHCLFTQRWFSDTRTFER